MTLAKLLAQAKPFNVTPQNVMSKKYLQVDHYRDNYPV